MGPRPGLYPTRGDERGRFPTEQSWVERHLAHKQKRRFTDKDQLISNAFAERTRLRDC